MASLGSESSGSSNLAFLNLHLATVTFRRIVVAAQHIRHFFPGDYIFDPSPIPKCAELTIILAFISQQILLLSLYLSVAKVSKLPVNNSLSHFHWYIDRLLLMGHLLAADSRILNQPRIHYSTPRVLTPSKFFGLISTKRSDWKERSQTVEFHDYLKAGQEAGHALQYLDNQMTGYIVRKSREIENNPIGRWLAKELDKIVHGKQAAVAPDHEFAVFALAFNGFRELLTNRQGEQGVEKFRAFMKMTHVDPRGLSPDQVSQLRYRIIGRFYRDELMRCDPPSAEKTAKWKSALNDYRITVERLVGIVEEDSSTEIDGPFAEAVRFVRFKMPYVTPYTVLEIANWLCESKEDCIWFYESQRFAKMRREKAIGSPLTPSSARGKKEYQKDVLHKVKKTTMTKHKSDVVRHVLVD